MKNKNVLAAIAEARRFIEAAKKVVPSGYGDSVEHGPDAAAAKRASLDLTKSLARMRREL